MKETYFHIVVKKLIKYKWKIINVQKIKNIVHHILDDKYKDAKAYKIIHHLKNKWYIISLKKDVLLIKSPQEEISELDLVEKYYWEALYLHAKNYCSSHWYIWWLKALELFVNNFDIPDEIHIYNKEKSSTEVVLLDKKLIFKVYNQKSKNLWSVFRKHLIKKEIWNRNFKLACLELSLLESLYSISIINKWYINELVKKILRKYKKNIRFEVFRDILRVGKHHASINRLHKIAKWIDENFAKELENIIKKHSFVLSY